VKTTATRSPTKKPAIFNVYNCYGKRKDPLFCAISDYVYKRKFSDAHKNECNLGLHDLLKDLEYVTSRGLRSLLSSRDFKNVQDKYELPTACKGRFFAVGCDYWSAIHVDDDYYCTYLSCVSEKVNNKRILFYFISPTYGMAFPIYSGSVMCFNPHLPHGTTYPTKKGVIVFSAYVSARTCNTHHAFFHT
jgi:hypothetical protein